MAGPIQRVAIAGALTAFTAAGAAAEDPPFGARATTLQHSSDPFHQTIVVYGDGYTAAEQNLYNRHVENAVVAGLRLDGFGPYVEKINIIRVNLNSPESGISTLKDPSVMVPRPAGGYCANGRNDAEHAVVRDTVFNFLVTGGRPTACNDGDRLIKNFDAIDKALKLSPDHRYVILNTDVWAGHKSGPPIYAMSAGDLGGVARHVFMHEAGHSMLGLADEYDSDGDAPFPNATSSAPNLTTATDYDAVKWNEFIDPDTALPTEEDDVAPRPGRTTASVAGVFEGGNGRNPTGVYRPTLRSLMRSLPPRDRPTDSLPFNDVAHQEASNEWYDFADPPFARAMYAMDFSSAAIGALRYTSNRGRNPTSFVDPYKDLVFIRDWSVQAYRFDPFTARLEYQNAFASHWTGEHPEQPQNDPFGIGLQYDGVQPFQLTASDIQTLLVSNHIGRGEYLRFFSGDAGEGERFVATNVVALNDVLGRNFSRPGVFTPARRENGGSSQDLVYANTRIDPPLLAVLDVYTEDGDVEIPDRHGRVRKLWEASATFSFETGPDTFETLEIQNIDDVLAGDLDGDGVDELLIRYDTRFDPDGIRGQSWHIVELIEFAPNGVGGLRLIRTIDSLDDAPLWNFDRVTLADHNADGRDDIIVVGQRSQEPSYLAALESPSDLADGDFALRKTRGPFPGVDEIGYQTVVEYGDFDGDDRTDIALHQPKGGAPGDRGALLVMLAKAGGGFETTRFAASTTAAFWENSAGSAQLIATDFDNDGMDELVVGQTFFLGIYNHDRREMEQRALYVHQIRDHEYLSGTLANTYASDRREEN